MYILSSFKLISGIYIVDQNFNLIFWDQINIPSLVLWFSQNFLMITQKFLQMSNSGNLLDKQSMSANYLHMSRTGSLIY